MQDDLICSPKRAIDCVPFGQLVFSPHVFSPHVEVTNQTQNKILTGYLFDDFIVEFT